MLPLLPDLIERLRGKASDADQVARSTGLLTALCTLSLFLFAPVWGWHSDRYGRRTVLLIGLIGFSATILTFAFIETLLAVYAERFPGGIFAAAVTPVALAAIGDLAGLWLGPSGELSLRRLRRAAPLPHLQCPEPALGWPNQSQLARPAAAVQRLSLKRRDTRERLAGHPLQESSAGGGDEGEVVGHASPVER